MLSVVSQTVTFWRESLEILDLKETSNDLLTDSKHVGEFMYVDDL
jgi:hypothetical protein